MQHERSINRIIITITLMITACAAGLYGCYRQASKTRESPPEIVWPKPPETPRIQYVTSVSGSEDMGITQDVLERLLRFFKGSTGRSIVTPYGVETDESGRLYVTDTFNRVVHVFDPVGDNYHIFSPEGGLFLSPIDIALDSKGNIFVSDSKGGVVHVFRNMGREYIMKIGGGTLKRPTGVSVNEETNELLIIDTLKSKILRYDLNNYSYKGTIGREGSDPGMFHYPTNIFVSENGNIFVSDTMNFRVQILSPEGNFLKAFGKPGDSPGFFARPRGVAVDSDGNIYVVDALFDVVQVFDAQGRLLMDFGGPGHGYGEFWLPSGIFIDSNDRIYISDSYNSRIQVFQYLKKQG